MKKAATIFISAVMTLSLGVNAFAAVIDHDIDASDLEVNTLNNNEDGYRVYSSSGNKSSHKIVVNGVKTTITLDNVTIETNNQSAVDIGDDAEVALIVEGANSLKVTNSEDAAGIHISGGSLTISGTDADDDILDVSNTGSDGAAIGSNNNEDFTGTITIDGGVTVNAENEDDSNDGAGIGSGKSGDMSGDITINEGSVVNAVAPDFGAGIGSGESGYMSGNITINGGEVYAYSGEYGAGIGSGDMGDDHLTGGMTGNITINDGTVVAISSNGTGIGSGDFGDMSGNININGGNVTAGSNGSDASIGAGENMSGNVTIHENAVITLPGNTLIGSEYESTGTIYLYKGAEINGVTVENVEDLKAAGILNDNTNVEVVEEGHSYSLSKSNNVSRIKAAKAGDTVYVYESQLSKGKVPYYVLEELAKMDDVTLVVVSDSGETVEIKSSNIPEKGKNAFFTVDELLEMVGK